MSLEVSQQKNKSGRLKVDNLTTKLRAKLQSVVTVLVSRSDFLISGEFQAKRPVTDSNVEVSVSNFETRVSRSRTLSNLGTGHYLAAGVGHYIVYFVVGSLYLGAILGRAKWAGKTSCNRVHISARAGKRFLACVVMVFSMK